MNKLPKDKRDKIIGVALATVLLVGGYWYIVIQAQGESLKEHREAALKAQKKVENARRLVQRELQVQADMAKAEQELKGIEEEMASGDLYSWMILTVNKFRVDYKVEIPSFSREQVGEVNLIPGFPYKAAIFTIRGTAYYHELGKFLSGFENQFPYMRVQNLDLEPVSLPVAGASLNAEDQEKVAFKVELAALIKPRENP